MQGIYCAAEHAVNAFTDTMRMELEADGIPISVSLVTPATDAILRSAEKPTREMIAGGAAELRGQIRPAATVAGLVALMFGAFAIANRVSPFE